MSFWEFWHSFSVFILRKYNPLTAMKSLINLFLKTFRTRYFALIISIHVTSMNKKELLEGENGRKISKIYKIRGKERRERKCKRK